jgi:hypothetical protein
VNRFGLRFVRVHLIRVSQITSVNVRHAFKPRHARDFKQEASNQSLRVVPGRLSLAWAAPFAGAGCGRLSRARVAAVHRRRGLLHCGRGGTATAFHTAGAAVCGQSGQTLRRPDAAGLQPVRKPHSYKPDLSAILSIKAAQDGRSWHQQAQVCVTASKLLCIVPGL